MSSMPQLSKQQLSGRLGGNRQLQWKNKTQKGKDTICEKCPRGSGGVGRGQLMRVIRSFVRITLRQGTGGGSNMGRKWVCAGWHS